MTTYTLPTEHIDNAGWQQISNDELGGPFQNGAIDVVGHSGNRWGLVLTYLNLIGDRRLNIEGFALSLKGMRNRGKVLMSTLGVTLKGAGGGSPVLNGAHSAGASQLSITGASTGITNWLKATDCLTIGNQLTKSVLAVDTDGSGNATIDIWPELHKDYSTATAIEIDAPFGVFFLSKVLGYDYAAAVGDVLIPSLALSLEQDVLA